MNRKQSRTIAVTFCLIFVALSAVAIVSLYSNDYFKFGRYYQLAYPRHRLYFRGTQTREGMLFFAFDSSVGDCEEDFGSKAYSAFLASRLRMYTGSTSRRVVELIPGDMKELGAELVDKKGENTYYRIQEDMGHAGGYRINLNFFQHHLIGLHVQCYQPDTTYGKPELRIPISFSIDDSQRFSLPILEQEIRPILGSPQRMEQNTLLD